MSTVFTKTAKGKTEIQTRENRLINRVRQILIFVDNKKTIDDLRAMNLVPEQDLTDILEMLVGEGFIEISQEHETLQKEKLLLEQKEKEDREEEIRLEQEALARPEEEKALKEQLKRERDEAKKHEKEEKEAERKRERDLAMGWSSNQNKRF